MQVFSRSQQINRWWLVTGLLSVQLGCASLMGSGKVAERFLACPMDSVWDTSLQVLKTYPITVKEKTKGLIETGWRVQYVKGPEFGLFRREGLSNKERSQLSLNITPIQSDVVRLQLTERRQHWGFRGGARLYAWAPVEPSEKEINHILNTLTEKLEAEGCFIES